MNEKNHFMFLLELHKDKLFFEIEDKLAAELGGQVAGTLKSEVADDDFKLQHIKNIHSQYEEAIAKLKEKQKESS